MDAPKPALLLALLLATPGLARPQDERPPETPEAPATAEEGLIRPYVPQTQREVLLAIRYCDCYLAVVGDEVVTQDEVSALARRPDSLETDPAEGQTGWSDQKKLQERQKQALAQIVERRLKSEGGENLGYDPLLVEQATSRFFENQIDALGGHAAAGPKLAEWGFTSQTFRSYIGEQLYGRFWEQSMTGQGVGPAGRPVADPYVRPGRMHSVYQDIVAEGGSESRALIGEQPAEATLRSFILPVPTVAEAEATRRRAELIRENVLNGVLTFDRALNEYAPPDFRSGDRIVQTISVPVLAESLRQVHGGAAGIDDFVDGISEGDLSPVLEGRRDGVLNFFVIYRVDAVQPATERLPFTDAGVQQRLTEKLRDARDELRVERGLAELARSTFVLPDSLRRGLLERGRRIAR